MKTPPTVAVIFGGKSGEHEVSVRSASRVIREMDRSRYEALPIAIGKDGSWLSPRDSFELLSSETKGALGAEPLKFCDLSGSVSPDPTVRGIVMTDGRHIPIDVAFPVIHGTNGEDGTLQGLLELAGIPYVGCGVLASSTGMDKVFMKKLFSESGLPICRYHWFTRKDWESDKESVLDEVEVVLGFPCFIKPANLGSSVGVSRAEDRESLLGGIEFASEFDTKIIVEECLSMREIECGVIGNADPRASIPGEYIVLDDSKKFLDYTEKYGSTGNNEFIAPANLSPEEVEVIRRMAVLAFKSIGGSGLARVDFFKVDGSNQILLNEINTMPGLTESSGFPKMWKASGLEMSEVIDTLIMLALERHQDKGRNRTSI